jgi:hypothetical protein
MNQLKFEMKPWLLGTVVALATAAAPAWCQPLTLTVNVNSGDAALSNPSPTPVTIDAYSILSTAGSLNPSGWQSFHSSGDLSWEEANASSIHISEASLFGNRDITNAGPIDLGNLVQPAPPAQLTTFGVVPSLPVQFQYHVEDGTTQTGQVVFIGNTLELFVDPISGEARIVNRTPFNVRIDAYSIVSASGSLNPGGWHSLDDAGQPGWDEATNSSSQHLSELNLTGSLGIAKAGQGAPIDLGSIFAGGNRDLQFTFRAATGSVSGDYNNDGIVNAVDYTVWRNNLNAPAGTLPNDPNGGVIGAAQYQTWKANYGATAGGTFETYAGLVRYVSLAPLLAHSVTVPEPSGGLIVAMMVGALSMLRIRSKLGEE